MHAKRRETFDRLGGLGFVFLVGAIFLQLQWGIGWVSGQVRLRSDLVLLDVEVVSRRTGKRIGYLRREDFRVYEDGVRQRIVYFDREDLPRRRRPLSVVLTVNPYDMSKVDAVEAIGRAARYAIDELWPEDKVALMVFGRRVRLLQELTADKELILEKLASLGEVRGIGGWQLKDEAIYQAARYLERASPRLTRRIILVIIGGNLPNVRMFLGHSPKAALKAVYRSNAMVYGIIVHTPEPMNWKMTRAWWKVNPILIGTQMIIRGGSLKKYARATGGEVLEVKMKEVASLVPEVMRRIEARYTLGYQPVRSEGDGRFHRITVEVASWVKRQHGKVIIRVRRGYIARRTPDVVQDE